MKKAKLTAALVAVLLIISFVFCSCANKPGAWSDNTKTVLTVAGHKISYDEYRYFYQNYKKDDPTLTEEQLHKLCLDAIASNIALLTLSDKYGVSYGKEQAKELDSYVEDAIESYGGEEEYRTQLENNALTGDVFRKLCKLRIIEKQLRDFMYDEVNNIIQSDDKTLDADIKNNFMAAKQILIQNDGGDDIKANEALAQNLLEELKSGADFDSIAAQYSEDKSMDAEYGYYFTNGQMISAFEEAVKSTEPNELYPDVVQSEIGYHIIMRIPLNSEYIDKHYETLRDAFKARRFNEMRAEEAGSLDIKKSDGFDAITF